MKVKLTKLLSTHNNLRTNEIVGECIDLPTTGQSFVIFGESLDKNATVRVVRTSLVKDVQKLDDRALTFETENSSYQLYVL